MIKPVVKVDEDFTENLLVLGHTQFQKSAAERAKEGGDLGVEK